MKPVKYLLSSLILFCLFQAAYGKDFRYLETTGKYKAEISWKINPEKYWTILEASHAEETYTTTNDTELNAMEWHLKNKVNKTEVSAKRQKNLIAISGIFRTKPIKRSIKIDDDPWYQPMSFSLSRFAKSNKKVIYFWTLNPNDLKPYKIKALNYGKETINIDGKEIKTYKVKVILTGFKSAFWHAFYWFRQDDTALIQYKGVDGPPTTPVTIIKLIEENPQPHSIR